jgi:AcrR family transcriptional regulator
VSIEQKGLTSTEHRDKIRTVFAKLPSNGNSKMPVSDEERSPRERRHQRTQQAILAAALSIVAESGADKLSMRAIADRIDYSPAGLYEYFGSKEEIIGALCREGHRTLKRYMAQVPQTLPPGEYMVELGMAYIRFAIQNPDYFLLIFTSLTSQPDVEEDVSVLPSVEMMGEDSSFPILLAGVERAVNEGAIHYLPALGLIETAYAFWAIVHGAAMLRITNLKQHTFDFDEADRLMLTAFIRGMSH